VPNEVGLLLAQWMPFLPYATNDSVWVQAGVKPGLAGQVRRLSHWSTAAAHSEKWEHWNPRGRVTANFTTLWLSVCLCLLLSLVAYTVNEDGRHNYTKIEQQPNRSLPSRISWARRVQGVSGPQLVLLGSHRQLSNYQHLDYRTPLALNNTGMCNATDTNVMVVHFFAISALSFYFRSIWPSDLECTPHAALKIPSFISVASIHHKFSRVRAQVPKNIQDLTLS